MSETVITNDLLSFLSKKEFLYLGTCDSSGMPFVVPKFLIRIIGSTIYLADYVMGRTCENLKSNPKVSLSIINLESLIGYEMNGYAEMLVGGDEFDEILKDLEKRKMHFSVERIIAGVQRGKSHQVFEGEFPEQLAVLIIKVKQIIHISPSGCIKKT